MTKRLLLIDSDIESIVKIKEALENTGEFDVTISANGIAAIETLRRTRHDCAVLAFDLPDMDAMEIIQALRQTQPDIPVIMTPDSDAQYERIRFLDAQGTLGRGYSARDLIPYVRSVIDRAAPGRAVPPDIAAAVDEFVPPQMPAALRNLMNQQPPHDGPSPTELLDAMELEHLTDEAPRIDLQAEADRAADLLAEFEELDRLQTGQPEPARPSTPDDAVIHLPAPGDPADSPAELRLDTDSLRSSAAANAPDTDRYATRPLDRSADPPHTTAQLQWPDADHDTRPFPPDTRPPDTSKLADTDQLDQIDISGLTRSPGARRPTSGQTPGGTTALLDWGEQTDDTSQLHGTDELDHLMEEHGWDVKARRDPAAPPYGIPEPPLAPGDTPPVPPPYFANEPFDDVLDAVSEPYIEPPPRSPEDRVFDELMSAMQPPTQPRPPGTSLEELLGALAADAAAPPSPSEGDSALDFVLDAIRRGQGLSPAADQADQRGRLSDRDLEGDDTTIAEVIGGMLDPSFEGVLAALAGEEIDDDHFEEPTYAREGTGAPLRPDAADQIGLDDMAAAEDNPAWLVEYEREGPGTSGGPVIKEPPISADDSSRYPATAALNAVRREDDVEDEFSLNDLLRQIETELPIIIARPRLRPLPSWERDSTPAEAERLAQVFGAEEDEAPVRADSQIAAMFDQMETLAPAADDRDDFPIPPEYAEPARPGAPVGVPEMPENAPDGVWDEDTGGWLDTAEQLALEHEQEVLTRMTPPPIRPSSEPPPTLPEMPDEIAPPVDIAGLFNEDTATADLDAYQDAYYDTEQEIDQEDAWTDAAPGEVLPTMADLLARQAAVLPDLRPDLPPEFEEAAAQDSTPYSPPDDDIEAAFYARLRDTAEHDVMEDIPDDILAELIDNSALIEVPVGEATARMLLEDLSDEDADLPDAAEPETGYEIGHADSGPVTTVMDADAGTVDYPGAAPDELDEEEEAAIAQAAIKLTRYSLEQSVEAIMLSRPGKQLALAGDLPDVASTHLFEIVDRSWQARTGEADSLIRYITLPESGEFLLYSLLVASDNGEDMALSMVFHATTPVRAIRRQARRLQESLDLIPEQPDEPEESPTLPNRPTALQRPVGLPQAEAKTSSTPPIPDGIPSRPPRNDVTYAAYTGLWLPDDPRLEVLDDWADALHDWIEEIAAAREWRIVGVDVRPDYVQVAVAAPDDLLPDAVMGALMTETARRSAQHFPTLTHMGGSLWADGYYVVSPQRRLSDREIARYITYQRQAQLG